MQAEMEKELKECKKSLKESGADKDKVFMN
jgi:hypothetical protein